MTSFVKHVVIMAAGLCLAASSPALADDPKVTPKPDGKAKSDSKDGKKNKKPKAEETPEPPKKIDVPVIKDHPSMGMFVPYFTADGKRQMNFKIGVATREDANHVGLKDMQIETFDEDEKHEMEIDLPNSVLDTDTSVISTHHHVDIKRYDFELTGDSMIFNTKTKQGGLAGNVYMIIYNLKGDEDSSNAQDKASKSPQPAQAEATQSNSAK